MTEQQFLALEPRERDALVAEKVMGAEWEHIPNYPGGPADLLRLRGNRGGILVERKEGKPLLVFAGTSHYTTDIAAAWTVVEKMESEGWGWCMTAYGVEYERGDSNDPDCEWAEYEVTPETVHTKTPLHICLAALKAKGVIE